MLSEAARGKGNFGIGTGTAQEAEEMGKAWVGPGYAVAKDGKTLISADGLRVYRPPSFKPKWKGGTTQANFETRVANQIRGEPIGNAHLDIKP